MRPVWTNHTAEIRKSLKPQVLKARAWGPTPLVQMMAERGIAFAHTTILRWVQRYVPDFEKRWNQYARAVGDSWRVDETDIKVKGQWVYQRKPVGIDLLGSSVSLRRIE
jgi:hypothetical protein